MSEPKVEPVTRTVIIEREIHHLSTAGKVGIAALTIAAILGFGTTLWAYFDAEGRATSSRRLNFEVLTELAQHSHAADCRADALTATAQAQAELLATLADVFIAVRDGTDGTNASQYLGLLHQQTVTLEAAIVRQKAALTACSTT